MKVPALLLLLAAASLHAQTLTPLQDSDVYAYLDRPTSSVATLGVSASGTGAPHSQRSLIQFDLTGVTLPANQLGTATLRLYVVQPDPNYGNLGTGDVGVFRQGSAWSVGTLRWSHLQPAEAHGTFAITATSGDTWVEIDVTSLVRDWLADSSPNHGFLLQAATEDPATLNVTFASMEVPGFRPQLVLTKVEATPTLTIERAGENIVLRWPSATTWVLQQSPTLAPGSWSAVTAASASDGDDSVLHLTPSATSAFYRLTRP